MLQVELHIQDVPRLFSRFCDAVGERHWLRREAAIRQEIKGHRFLREYLIEENEIAFSLARCSELVRRHRILPLEAIDDAALYPAFSLVAQTLSIMDRSNNDQKHKLIRRLHGAFNNPDDMRAIQLELLTATHFVRRGLSVSFPEMDDFGTFDLLVDGLGESGLEVECKLITRDKGRKIHRRDALEFFNVAREIFMPVHRKLVSGLAIVLTVQGRLPPQYKEKRDLAQWALKQLISNGNEISDDVKSIRIIEFDAGQLHRVVLLGDEDARREEVDRITSTTNREVMLIGSESGGVLVIVVQCASDDAFMEYTFKTLSQAAKSQLTKTRPAMLMVGFHAVAAGDLLGIAAQDAEPGNVPTALRIGSSKFLSSDGRSHVVGVGFLSRSSLEPAIDGVSSSGGSAYIFHNDDSAFWHQDFKGLFQES